MLSLVVGYIAIGVVLVICVAQKRRARLRRVGSGLLVSYFTILLILGAGEVYFHCCYAESANVATLATQNWLARYWHTNSWGFRDREWTPEDYAGKKTVVVLGDSFAAGWGLKDTAERFSDVLAAKLGDGYALMNAGVYGTSTPEQLNILKKFPVQKPDVVILQYFLNDIDYARLQLGLLPQPSPTPDWALQSYLGNFIYWRFVAPLNPDAAKFDHWWEDDYKAYDNVGIWSIHQQELEDFINYVDSIHARLIVLIFPNLLDVVGSIAYVDRVAQVFQASGHNDVLKLFDAAAEWDQNDLVISKQDAHASVSFNRYVGETLYSDFFASK
jgi:GDSL-like lipase/acylhydrolase family protein